MARHWRALAAAGVLLGLGFGLSLASFAAARQTSSAYDRILAAADAPDAAITLGQPPEEAEQSLRAIDGITAQRIYAGFLGSADGVDPIVTTALLAPIRDRFPIELPKLRAGRLPHPDAPDEALINSSAADRGGIKVGQRLHFRLFDPASAKTAETDVTIVGVGTFPAEVVTDETNVLGLFVFTRAFYDAHRDLVVYAASNVDLAPGFDARGDLAPAISALGHELQSARAQERKAIDDALRPLVIVLVALGVLAFGGTAVAAGQVIQRNANRWLADDAAPAVAWDGEQADPRHRARELSAHRRPRGRGCADHNGARVTDRRPVGPLHDLDPTQGFAIDATVAVLGTVAIIATIVVLTLVFSSVRHRLVRPMLRRSPAGWRRCRAGLRPLPGSPSRCGPTTAMTAPGVQSRRRPRRPRAWPCAPHS